jgi:enoyl-CoA hydratase
MIHRHLEGEVAVLRLEHGKANALDTELLEELEATLAELEAGGAGAGAAVVLTGTGSIFSAGVDLFRVLDGGSEYLAGFLPAISRALERLFAFPRPVVAAVNGHAVAGGALLCAACDLRLAAAGGGRIGVPELLVGVPFPVAALEILRFATPREHLQPLVYGGATHDPQAALARGLVDEVVSPPERLVPRALEAARELAALPAEAFRLTKEQLRRPALERMRRLGPGHDPAVRAVWADPESHRRIRAYLDKTLHRGGR